MSLKSTHADILSKIARETQYKTRDLMLYLVKIGGQRKVTHEFEFIEKENYSGQVF